MPYFEWDSEKNKKLKSNRGVSFEDVVIALEEERLLEILRHPNKAQYPNQKIFVVEIRSYAYYVPFIETTEKIFLKTIFPNRKATRKFLLK